MSASWKAWIAVVAFLVLPVAARADVGSSVTRENWPTMWVWEPGIVAGLFASAAFYVSGLRWLRRATHAPAKLRREAWWFSAGWVLLAVALVSPVHALGSVLFSAHMTQHELLMVAAAPLLVLGRPGLVWLWAIPRGTARHITGAITRMLGPLRHWLGHPSAAWLAQTIALWAWHAPRLYDKAVEHPLIHALQHACFLGTAVWFWHTVFFGPRRRAGYGMAVVYLFTTALHSGALGALITFARDPWYTHYIGTAPSWGLRPIEDQQLGGLIMWVPSGLAYIIAALALFAQWMTDTDSPGATAPGSAQPIASTDLNPETKCVPSP